MQFTSLLTWFLSLTVGFGSHPLVAGGGPVAHAPKTITSGLRIDIAGGGPVAHSTTPITGGVRSDVAGGGPVAKK